MKQIAGGMPEGGDIENWWIANDSRINQNVGVLPWEKVMPLDIKFEYRPLEEFQYKWRWTDPKYNLLPGHALEMIFPLAKRSSEKLFEYSLKYSRGWEYRPSEDLFSDIVSIEAGVLSEDADIEGIRTWLANRLPKDLPEIFISWQPDMAVKTNTGIFVKYWDDFCYPGDDVAIFPASEDWVLLYWHEERFYFAQRKRNA
jgi:hypothetical protein